MTTVYRNQQKKASVRDAGFLSLRAVIAALIALILMATHTSLVFAGEPAKTNSADARLLNALLPDAADDDRAQALKQISNAHDTEFIAPLIDLLGFVHSRDEATQILQAMSQLTDQGVDTGTDAQDAYLLWYGAQTKPHPPPGYTGWKGELLAQAVDPRFREFLYDGAPTTGRVEEVVWGGVKVDGIRALVNPAEIPAADADYLPDTDPVFGVTLHGESRAYPLRILDAHEMADDVIGGEPIALAYCTLCGAGILYDTAALGTPHVFGSSGLLYRSNKLMYDHETHTLWNQLTGEPVIGPLAGKGIKLRVLPSVLTSWGVWKQEHPDTRVLSDATGISVPYQLGMPYGSYFASPETMFPVWQRSRILPTKARVFALQVGDHAKAYPLDALNQAGGIVSDTLNNTPVVVVYQDAVGRTPLPPDWVAALHEQGDSNANVSFANDLTLKTIERALKAHPSLSGEMTADFLLAIPTEARLTLLTKRTARSNDNVSPGMFAPSLRDEVAERGLIGETRAYARGAHRFTLGATKDHLLDETKHPWRVTEDALIDSDGTRLERLGGHLAYWFGWFAFHPQTEVYRAEKKQ